MDDVDFEDEEPAKSGAAAAGNTVAAAKSYEEEVKMA